MGDLVIEAPRGVIGGMRDPGWTPSSAVAAETSAPSAESAARRIVGRPARADEVAAVAALLEGQGLLAVADLPPPLASVVALFEGAVVGAAAAWPGAVTGTAWAAVGVVAGWRGVGVAGFLGRRLAQELDAAAVCSVEAPPFRLRLDHPPVQAP